MTEGNDGFLQRWSRQKHAARREEDLHEPALPSAEIACEIAVAPTEDSEPLDLPPIESLGEESDYTAFLRSGVPPGLRQAALRRAWASKAAITGHKPLVDYDWDFHAPGYGKLRPTDDVKKMVGALFRHLTVSGETAGAPLRPIPAGIGAGPETAAMALDKAPETAPATAEAAVPASGPETPTARVEDSILGEESSAEAAFPMTSGQKRKHGGATPR